MPINLKITNVSLDFIGCGGFERVAFHCEEVEAAA